MAKLSPAAIHDEALAAHAQALTASFVLHSLMNVLKEKDVITEHDFQGMARDSMESVSRQAREFSTGDSDTDMRFAEMLEMLVRRTYEHSGVTFRKAH